MPKLIVVIGRVYYGSKSGSPYHSVHVIVDGQSFVSGMRYGGEGVVEQTAAELAADVLPGLDNKSTLWKYCRDNEIKLIRDVSTVAKEKSLHQGD